MISEELESLIQTTIMDNVLEEKELVALIERACNEGSDLSEVKDRILSIMEERVNKLVAEMKDMQSQIAELEVSVLDENEDLKKEFTALDELIEKAKGADGDEFKTAKESVERQMRKIIEFYGVVPEVELRIAKVKAEMQLLETEKMEDNLREFNFSE